MNNSFKLLLVLLCVVALVLPLLLKGPSGQPIMSLSDWLPKTNLSLPDNPFNTSHDNENSRGSSVVTPSTTSSSKAMYKWKDQRGQWHFSHETPPADADASLEPLPEVKNVMEAPVNEGDNSSTISLPGGFNLGK